MRARLRELAGLLRQPRVSSIVIARGLPVMIWIGFLTYNSIIVVRVMGGTPTQAGILAAVASLVFAFAGSQAGRITAMFDSRLYPLLGGHFCLGVGFAVFLFASRFKLAGVGIAVAGVGFGVTGSLYRSVITGLAGDSLRGGLVSVGEAFGRVCATPTPIFMGGVIAVATPHVGVGSSTQVAGLGAAVVDSIGGVICLLVTGGAASVNGGE